MLRLSSLLMTAGALLLASQQAQAANQRAQVVDATNFCTFLPPVDEADREISDTEWNAQAFCMGDTPEAESAGAIPDGFIQSAHFVATDDYVQITGQIDPTKANLDIKDWGGQYDVKAPDGSKCAGWTYYVNLIEPASYTWCIRCCNDDRLCNRGISEKGCEHIIPGDYSGPMDTSITAPAGGSGSAASNPTTSAPTTTSDSSDSNSSSASQTSTPTSSSSSSSSSSDADGDKNNGSNGNGDGNSSPSSSNNPSTGNGNGDNNGNGGDQNGSNGADNGTSAQPSAAQSSDNADPNASASSSDSAASVAPSSSIAVSSSAAISSSSSQPAQSSPAASASDNNNAQSSDSVTAQEADDQESSANIMGYSSTLIVSTLVLVMAMSL
ncbi:hypothetical protein O0I10_001666 [Lichtheimia ornata]|uniref:Secreted protein n=1 Tax=Lichtheimia ornata TaxID=688661 RepID=A0AAD7VD04_9FUNG|nr:uncharacterized protein O0I10_001666 [Lichtheimia ornata]KAJ8662702.1 hypothetical protein O0I10_001666 [Lichtheimia ornata]